MGNGTLSDQQIAEAERLLVGIEAISEAVHRLNTLGKQFNIPPIAIRFQPSGSIYGENPYSTLVNSMIADEYSRRVMHLLEPQRLAA